MKTTESLTRLALVFLLITTGFYAYTQVDEFSPRERLGNHINTPFTETKPIISYDNTILYLTRQYHPMNTGGKDDIQDIYYATRDAERIWSEPINIGAPLNNEFPNGISSLSQGGDTALVINVFTEKNYDKGASITFKSGDNWTNPQGIDIHKFKNNSDFIDYFITNDGKRMFLAIDSKGSYGDQDIYISEKIDDFHWTEPINIGEAVNTYDAEFSPFLSSDGKTLFFSSFGHEGFGGADIYYSQRLDDTWLNWSPAENLGDRFNTEGFEAYFTIPSRGEHAYFVSDVGSNEDSRDIFRAVIPLELNPTPGVIVSGITRNKLTKEAFTAVVDVTCPDPSVEDKHFVTKNDIHKYSRSIFEFPKTFRLLATQKNYLSTSQYLKVEKTDKSEVKADLYLVPIEVGNTLISHDVVFETGTSTMTDLGKEEMGRMVQYMKGYPVIKFEITVHVQDGEGNEQALSEERLAAINEFFLSNGIDRSRVFPVAGMGATVPFENKDNILVYDPSKPDNRVEFTIVADRDKDLVTDLRDECPDTPGSVKTAGCPDRDDDLVMDKLDKCPDIAGIPENRGCAPITDEDKAVFEEALQGIQFETAKDIIKPVSFPILDNVVGIMKRHPEYFLRIEGHTDSDGTEESNQDLSERRAASTRKYLEEKGISGDRMKEYGFGESKPVASNDTAAGKQKNRRVVFEVVFDESDL